MGHTAQVNVAILRVGYGAYVRQGLKSFLLLAWEPL